MSNPFERLRALARRSAREDPWDDELAAEAASALTALEGDPGLVVACRRMLAHHRASATLWWVLAHVLAAPDPRAAARRCREALDADTTAQALAAALPLQDEGAPYAAVGWTRTVDIAFAARVDLDVVSVEIDGADPTAALRRRTTERSVRVIEPWQSVTAGVSLLLIPAVALDDRGWLAPAGTADLLREVGTTPVWVVGGIGRVLPRRLFDALATSTEAGDPSGDLERLGYDAVESVVGPRGAEPPADAVAGFDCPLPGELLRPL